jgi:hydroxymethylbilane synthase
MTLLRLGTRGSLLARSQSAIVAEQIKMRRPDVQIEQVIVKTTGDQIADRPLWEEGGKGLFVKELELALLENRIDFAVHSLKDMPMTMPLVDESDLVIAAVPPREDVRDVLISQKAATIATLPPAARIGAGSLRRKCQLLALRNDLRIEPLRGNIDTRVKKLRAGEFDATILAMAGLKRAGLLDPAIMYSLPLETILPAPGQGALALQCRKQDAKTRAILAEFDDANSHAEVAAEREIVAAMKCDCHSAIGVYARTEGKTMEIRAILGAPGGELPIKRALTNGDIANVSEITLGIVSQLSSPGDSHTVATKR